MRPALISSHGLAGEPAEGGFSEGLPMPREPGYGSKRSPEGESAADMH